MWNQCVLFQNKLFAYCWLMQYSPPSMPSRLVCNFPACHMRTLCILETNFRQSSDQSIHGTWSNIALCRRAGIQSPRGHSWLWHCTTKFFSNGMKSRTFGIHGHWWAIFGFVCDRRTKLALLVHRLFMLLCRVATPCHLDAHLLELCWTV